MKNLFLVLVSILILSLCSFTTVNEYINQPVKTVLKEINEKPKFVFQKKTKHLKFNVYGWESKLLIISSVNDKVTEVLKFANYSEYTKVLNTKDN